MTGINEFGNAQDGSDLDYDRKYGKRGKGIDVVTAQPPEGVTVQERPLVVGAAAALPNLTVKPAIPGDIDRVFAAAERAKATLETGAVPVTGAKSRATTANPKDLFGAVKVDMTKVAPISIAHEAMAMMDGADKYGPYNWRDKPVIASIYIAAYLRHGLDWWDGQELADDSLVHHLGHGKACAGIILDAQHRGVLIDDRPAHDDMLADALDEMSKTLRKKANWKKEGAAAYDRWAEAKDGRTPPKSPYDTEKREEIAPANYWQRGFDQRRKQVEEGK